MDYGNGWSPLGYLVGDGLYTDVPRLREPHGFSLKIPRDSGESGQSSLQCEQLEGH